MFAVKIWITQTKKIKQKEWKHPHWDSNQRATPNKMVIRPHTTIHFIFPTHAVFGQIGICPLHISNIDQSFDDWASSADVM